MKRLMLTLAVAAAAIGVRAANVYSLADATGTPIGVASATGDVMIVSLSRDAAGHFPVSFYRGVDMGVFNCDVYKTTKIALRRIQKGVAYPVEARATSYPITKTLVPQRDFYVGLFEITDAQYDRVMGAESPSASMTPKRYASYSAFRSPTGSTQLDPPSSDKFIGILLADAVDASGNPVGGFDLPTANQWEIAARAGSTGQYGAYLDADGRFVEGTADNVSDFAQTGSGHVVGSLRPNAWGLYDMSGGVGEWCRTSGNDVETAVKDSYWPLRGNAVTSWEIGHILSGYNSWTSYSGVNCGARLSCTLDVADSAWIDGKWTGEPDRYIPFIESRDGFGQYIDTGYTHRSNTRIECEVAVSNAQSSGWAAVFGARKNNYGSNAFCFFAKDNDWNVRYNRTGEETVGGAFPRNQRVALSCVGDTARWSEVGSDSTNTVTTAGTVDDGANTMFIFVVNTAGEGGKSPDGSYCAMKLYSFKIYEGEELRHDYCPCVKNGEGCLYDKVTGEYLRNAGLSTFGGEDLPQPMRPIPGSNLTWGIVDGVLSIGGTGPMPDFVWSDAPWYEIRASITEVKVGEGVRTIGERAFYRCDNLTSASLPKVTTIGKQAFKFCSRLASVEMPEVLTIGDEAFRNCPLTALSLPKVTTIGDEAFSGCLLTALSLPRVATIGNQAFRFCSQLASVEMPEVLTIGDEAFRYCPLTALSLPKVTTIGDWAFSGCPLTALSLPKVTAIGSYAFSWCSQLASAELPEVLTLEDSAFALCSSMTMLSLPKVESIGNSSFVSCSQLHMLMISQLTNGDNQHQWGLDQRYILRVPTGMKYVDEDAQIVGEGQIAVSVESIQAAKAETVAVEGGYVTLGVSVNTNGDFRTATKDWRPITLTRDMVDVLDGKVIITIPASAESGFMILQSGDAQIKK